MIDIQLYIPSFYSLFPELKSLLPWEITAQAPALIQEKIKTLSSDYIIRDAVAIHKDARVEEHVIIKSPAIISAGCFIGAHAYIRGGVFLGEGASIGPGCEIKSSFIMPRAALAHFNFAGDSIVGSQVNMEAGSIIANHYNERADKTIKVLINNKEYITTSTKFGALVGDGTRIGANAVLSPGTILLPNAIVKRLELIEQIH
ncbi:MAG TPA: DapH/DapD/GlmU-related protein [Ohtaekwangia sp.]|uniref:DapH/DapD/GlmU-related protein n=1 Tax=Ohtaekwangia sp. TaxID=2066019 RepID=UPI002F94B235